LAAEYSANGGHRVVSLVAQSRNSSRRVRRGSRDRFRLGHRCRPACGEPRAGIAW